MAALPTFTCLLGVSLVTAVPAVGVATPMGPRLALTSAAVAPLLAALLLRWFAPRFDRVLLAAAGMMTAVGATTLYFLAREPAPDRGFYESIATRHGIFVCAGFVALIVGVVISRRLRDVTRFPLTLLALALVLIAGTIFFGDSVNGARLWLQLGWLRFQPSEAARLLLATFLAVYLYERRHLIASPWRIGKVDLPPAPYLLPLGVALLVAVGILVIQSDLGMAALVALGALASLAAVLGSRLALAMATAAVAAVAAASYAIVPRVRDRVTGWLDPWTDPAQRGFQFIQAEYGLASAGMVGAAADSPARHVPEAHTDLILAAVAAQFGWLGAAGVIMVAEVLVCRCALIALKLTDGFSALLVYSLTALFAIQFVLIAGGTLRILPLTGLTFPLVSYGGTSLVVTCFALGIIIGLGAGDERQQR